MKPEKSQHTPGPREPIDGYYPGEELARLKAINSDLLAALKRAEAAMEAVRSESDSLEERYAKDHEVISAAIARAEGR